MYSDIQNSVHGSILFVRSHSFCKLLLSHSLEDLHLTVTCHTTTNLYIHVVVSGHQETLVLHSPLELHHYRLASETIQKWLGIQRDSLQEKFNKT